MDTREPPAGAQHRRVTLEDVAAAAGVSRQTVSNVVNGTGRLSERTRSAVKEAIGVLDYHPHVGARGLQSRRTLTLAHPMPTDEVVPDNIIRTEWAGALVRAAAQRDYRVLLTANNNPDAIEALARSGTVDGFVLSQVDRRDAVAQLLAAQRVPFSSFGRLDRPLPQTWVDIDNHGAIRAVVRHLAERGHRRIGFVGFRTGQRWDRLREAGFRAGLIEAGLVVRPEQVLLLAKLDPAPIDAMLGERRPPTAVVSGSDLLAAAVYAAAAGRRLRIGADADLAVTGLDGSAIGRALTPSLTTVIMPLRAVAERVVDRLLLELAGSGSGRGEVVEAPLIVGDSS